jgi:hypothetical protein
MKASTGPSPAQGHRTCTANNVGGAQGANTVKPPAAHRDAVTNRKAFTPAEQLFISLAVSVPPSMRFAQQFVCQLATKIG